MTLLPLLAHWVMLDDLFNILLNSVSYLAFSFFNMVSLPCLISVLFCFIEWIRVLHLVLTWMSLTLSAVSNLKLAGKPLRTSTFGCRGQSFSKGHIFPSIHNIHIFRKVCILLRFSNLSLLCINFVLVSSETMAMVPIVFFIPFISQMHLPEVTLVYCLFKNEISSWICLLISLCFCFLIHLFQPLSSLFFSPLIFLWGRFYSLFLRSQTECLAILLFSLPF